MGITGGCANFPAEAAANFGQEQKCWEQLPASAPASVPASGAWLICCFQPAVQATTTATDDKPCKELESNRAATIAEPVCFVDRQRGAAATSSSTATSPWLNRQAAVNHVRAPGIISLLRPQLEAAVTPSAGNRDETSPDSFTLALTGPIRSWLEAASVLPFYVLRALMHLRGEYADEQAFLVHLVAAAATSQPGAAGIGLAQLRHSAAAAAKQARRDGPPPDTYSSYDAAAGVERYMAAVKKLARVPATTRKDVAVRFGKKLTLAEQPQYRMPDVQRYADVFPAVLAVQQDDLVIDLLRAGPDEMSLEGVQLLRQLAAQQNSNQQQ